MTLSILRRACLLAAAASALACVPAFGDERAADDHARPGRGSSPVSVQLLAINDFHGAIEARTGLTFGGAPAGGVEYLTTMVRELRAANPATATVAAGDLIGASPLISALFHDEPTIEAMNNMGLEFNAAGNHEYDEGTQELVRIQRGGCHPVDGCQTGHAYAGADFRILTANTVRKADGRPLLAATGIKRFRVPGKDVRVGFIGVTLEATPAIVSPSGIADVDFLDEADTINHYVKILREEGVRTIVALIHQGGAETPPTPSGNGCNTFQGDEIKDIIARTSPEVDAFITGHTHQAYNCVIDGRPVTSAASDGRLLTQLTLTVDRRSDDPVGFLATNHVIRRTPGTEAADQSALVKHYKELSAPLVDRVVGRVTADITRTANAAGESALGDVIADGQLEATKGNGAQAALMNPGGIRANLPFAPDDGQTTFGDLFTVQPFGNILQTLTLTGAQVQRVLEQQWCGQPAGGRILQIAGLTYTWDASRPLCTNGDLGTQDRVLDETVRIAGRPVTPTGTYKITANNFIADGGDGFTVLKEATERAGGGQDIDAFVAYFQTRSPVAPGPQDRVTRLSERAARR